jgi:hypothetical protein
LPSADRICELSVVFSTFIYVPNAYSADEVENVVNAEDYKRHPRFEDAALDVNENCRKKR